ncbi:MAG: hypothetical protein WC765_01435 [Phycisphaerae bacterium]
MRSIFAAIVFGGVVLTGAMAGSAESASPAFPLEQAPAMDGNFK